MCTLNFLKALGIDLKPTDTSYAGHAYSVENYSEDTLNFRDMIINYIKDNAYDGKDDIFLDSEELFSMYELVTENSDYVSKSFSLINNSTPYVDFKGIEEKTGVEENFLKFMIGFGVIEENNKYHFKSDDEIYFQFKDLYTRLNEEEADYSKRTSMFLENYDIDFIKNQYEKYEKFKEREKNKQTDSKNETIPIEDLSKFKNIDIARDTVSEIRKNFDENSLDFSICLLPNGCHLAGNISKEVYSLEDLDSLAIDYEDEENFSYIHIEKNIEAKDNKELVSNISTFTDDLAGIRHDEKKVKENISSKRI